MKSWCSSSRIGLFLCLNAIFLRTRNLNGIKAQRSWKPCWVKNLACVTLGTRACADPLSSWPFPTLPAKGWLWGRRKLSPSRTRIGKIKCCCRCGGLGLLAVDAMAARNWIWVSILRDDTYLFVLIQTPSCSYHLVWGALSESFFLSCFSSFAAVCGSFTCRMISSALATRPCERISTCRSE